ncbi:phage tail-collar fiber domain-containing protein [Fusobacterium polymorphum]|uniref:phage tail-collar fiber domain-containing protein n=1 Tax=Fusobacterium nucleatum subsp. polymorphum TaxID=76857 RepID=UPI00300A38DE
MKFSGLTKKGRLYLAKIQAAEEPIQFTKIKFGDGKLSEHENPADLVDIKNIKVEKSILNKEQKEDAVILTTIIDNVGLVEGYFPRETGIYVQDEDQEVLYFYMNDGDETSWLPPEVDGPHRMEMKINLISSNTGSVLVHNDGKDLYITKDYLESNYTQKGNFNGTAQDIEDRVVAAVGKEDGKFPLTESVAGNIYYFPGNKKFYYCLKSQTSRVSVPNADFEELSIYQNRKKLENLYTNTVELATKITKSTNISELKNYKFWLVDISISIHLNGISHQKYTFTATSAVGFFYNDNFHTLGKYAVQIDTNGNITLTGEAVQNGYIKVSIYGLY